MAIKRFGDYEKTQAYTDFQTLPKGGYIGRILNAEVKENSNGQYIQLAVDIAEGEYKDFFMNEWKNQQGEDKKWHCNFLLNVPKDDGSERDGWTKRRFKTVIVALEDSNSGYHFDWDEQKFKGKLIGCLFNEREYEGNDGTVKKATNLAQITSVEKVRSGDFKIPADKLLNKQSTPFPQQSSAPAQSSSLPSWMSVPDNASDSMPF